MLNDLLISRLLVLLDLSAAFDNVDRFISLKHLKFLVQY